NSLQSQKPKWFSAGTITVHDGATNLSLAPNDLGYYSIRTGSEIVFPPGSVLEVSAVGGDIPSFTTTLRFPGAARIDPLPEAVSRDRDLKVTWTGGSPGGRLRLRLSNDSERLVEIECQFDAATHHGTVARQLLSVVNPGTRGFWQGLGVVVEENVTKDV